MNADVKAEITEPSGPRGTWMISFVDLISVLLTFMVMLYAISDVHDVPAWHGTDRLSETVDWHRELPTHGARNGAEAVHSLPAMDLDYLEGVLAAALADEPVRPTIVRQNDQVIVALPPPTVTPGRNAPALGEAERHLLRILARPLNTMGNRLEVHGRTVPTESVDAGNSDASATPSATAWTAGVERAMAAARTLAEAGLERPVGSYGLADQPVDRVPVGTQDRHQSPASRLQLVILAGAAE